VQRTILCKGEPAWRQTSCAESFSARPSAGRQVSMDQTRGISLGRRSPVRQMLCAGALVPAPAAPGSSSLQLVRQPIPTTPSSRRCPRLLLPPLMDRRPAASVPRTDVTGRGYMKSRLREERLARKLAEGGREIGENLNATLESVAEASSLRAVGGRMVLAGAYLVPADQTANFVASVRELGGSYSGRVELVCTGPWPPYSFVDVELSSDG
jgi:hypothetical protein